MSLKLAAAAAFLALTTLTACAQQDQSTYRFDEVGRASAVSFGIVVAVRPIKIQGENTGTGAIVGGAAGGLAGSAIGAGGGNAAAIVGGVVVGAIAGAVAEQALADRRGLEYTVTLQNGATITIAQNQGKDDRVMQPGERVMVQLAGGYQRVLPADNLPTTIKRPQGITVTD